ncbi:MAG: 39S ribosomal protein L24, mitochondrial [Phylliscum demangeonii]|nr:MAG: 39S ribosomal protein L24, mitochondrial [Phylliscum demangeonii]
MAPPIPSPLARRLLYRHPPPCAFSGHLYRLRLHVDLDHHRHAFSSSARALARSSDSQLAHLHADLPPYPYGPQRTYKQSNFGLYEGAHIQFGNNISNEWKIKTRRHWSPNVQSKRLWSDALNRFIRIRVTTRALRTIDKVGGLDEYLLGDSKGRIKALGMAGWALRWRILQTEAVIERFRRQRLELGSRRLESLAPWEKLAKAKVPAKGKRVKKVTMAMPVAQDGDEDGDEDEEQRLAGTLPKGVKTDVETMALEHAPPGPEAAEQRREQLAAFDRTLDEADQRQVEISLVDPDEMAEQRDHVGPDPTNDKVRPVSLKRS